jgi:hypothetical protein
MVDSLYCNFFVDLGVGKYGFFEHCYQFPPVRCCFNGGNKLSNFWKVTDLKLMIAVKKYFKEQNTDFCHQGIENPITRYDKCLSEISGSHSCEYGDGCLLGYRAV